MSSSRSAATAAARSAARTSSRASGRSATGSARQPRSAAPPRRMHLVRSLVGVRWDRMGRIGLLIVLAIVSVIGIQRVMSYLSVRSAADRALVQVRQLTRDNARLAAIQRSLSEPSTIAADARRLGMVRAGEHTFSVTSGR